MSTLIVNNTKEQQIEFTLEVQGLPSDPEHEHDNIVRFVIETGQMTLSFPCRKEEGNKWVTDLPPLPQLAKTAYNYLIEAIIDGYYFIPTRGIINVVGSFDLYTTTPTNVSLPSTVATPTPTPVPTGPVSPVIAVSAAPPTGETPPVAVGVKPAKGKSAQEVAADLMRAAGMNVVPTVKPSEEKKEEKKPEKKEEKKPEKKKAEEDEEITFGVKTETSKLKDEIVKRILSETVETVKPKRVPKIKKGSIVER